MSDALLSKGDDIIYARASAAGRAGVTVFRLSGTGLEGFIKHLIKKPLKPRHALYCSIYNLEGGIIDQGLAILFSGPHSFTGEDVLELHLHGSRAVEVELYYTLSKMGGRLAEAGEFTLRALKNNKLDLTQSEALLDLIDSETNQQKNLALNQLEGGLAQHVETWRSLLLKTLAPLAADIDFPDEEDIPAAIAAQSIPIIDDLIQQLEAVISSFEQTKIIREGASIVLIGAPNVGKSSLLNRLSGSDVAIVSDLPGTTRDVVEARLNLDGYLVTLADTAGLRDNSDDQIEQEGMRRTSQKAEQSDFRIHVVDIYEEWIKRDHKNVSRETISLPANIDILVLNKIDLLKLDNGQENKWLENHLQKEAFEGKTAICISAKTNSGIEELLNEIKSLLKQSSHSQSLKNTTGILTRQRHVDAIQSAIAALGRARKSVVDFPELAAEDLRLANRALGRVIGVVDVEDILGEIFSNFCIGK